MSQSAESMLFEQFFNKLSDMEVFEGDSINTACKALVADVEKVPGVDFKKELFYMARAISLMFAERKSKDEKHKKQEGEYYNEYLNHLKENHELEGRVKELEGIVDTLQLSVGKDVFDAVVFLEGVKNRISVALADTRNVIEDNTTPVKVSGLMMPIAHFLGRIETDIWSFSRDWSSAVLCDRAEPDSYEDYLYLPIKMARQMGDVASQAIGFSRGYRTEEWGNRSVIGPMYLLFETVSKAHNGFEYVDRQFKSDFRYLKNKESICEFIRLSGEVVGSLVSAENTKTSDLIRNVESTIKILNSFLEEEGK